MRKTIAASGVVIAGLVVLAIGLMNSLFTVAPAFEDLTDGFRDTVMSDEAISMTKADISALSAVSAEFSTKVVPTMAGLLGMEPTAFGEYLAAEYPAVATGATALPDIVEQFTGVTDLIESQQANFESADSLPTSSIPATTLPWMILGIGLIGIGVGIWMFMDGRTATWTALVFGIVVVVSALSLSFLGKSAAADDMNDAFRPVYTAELVQQSSGALQIVGAMGEEMQTAMIPGLAGALDMSATDVQAFIASEFPATNAALTALPDAMGRFETTVGAFDAQLDNYDTIKDTALSPISWTVLLSGAAMALFGAFGMFSDPDADTRPQPMPQKDRKLTKTAR